VGVREGQNSDKQHCHEHRKRGISPQREQEANLLKGMNAYDGECGSLVRAETL